jgi:TPR repeat protein
MGGKKDRGRINRAKQMAAATAVIEPTSAPVQEPPAPSHTFYELDTRATLAKKLADTIEAFQEDIRRETDPWAAIEYGSNSAALVAAAMRGDAKAQLAMLIGTQQINNTQQISRPEYTKVVELASHQKNPGVELWIGMESFEFIRRADDNDANRALLENAMKIADANHAAGRSQPEVLSALVAKLHSDQANQAADLGAVNGNATAADDMRRVMIMHLTASADSGSTYAQKAQYVLGMVMYQSACEPIDFLYAAACIRNAAKQGVLEAQYELGKMFLHHLFCPSVLMRLARKYIRRASKQGHVEATACMKELRKCVLCGADDAPLACSRCREARYCDSTCSEKHWCDGGGVGRDVDGEATEPHRDVCRCRYSRSQRKKKKKQQLERGK